MLCWTALLLFKRISNRSETCLYCDSCLPLSKSLGLVGFFCLESVCHPLFSFDFGIYIYIYRYIYIYIYRLLSIITCLSCFQETLYP